MFPPPSPITLAAACALVPFARVPFALVPFALVPFAVLGCCLRSAPLCSLRCCLPSALYALRPACCCHFFWPALALSALCVACLWCGVACLVAESGLYACMQLGAQRHHRQRLVCLLGLLLPFRASVACCRVLIVLSVVLFGVHPLRGCVRALIACVR